MPSFDESFFVSDERSIYEEGNTWFWWLQKSCCLTWLVRLAGKGCFWLSTWWRLLLWWLSMDHRSFLLYALSWILRVNSAKTSLLIPWVFFWWSLDILGYTFLYTVETTQRSYFIIKMVGLLPVLFPKPSSDRWKDCPKVYPSCTVCFWTWVIIWPLLLTWLLYKIWIIGNI